MKKLTKENIRFIDTYLKNSNVIFFDIRMEITDHVASEIEAKMNQGDGRGFYDIFKSYMLKHKTGLLKNLKKFRKQADKKVFRLILTNCYHPLNLLITTLVVAAFYLLENFIIGHDSVVPIAVLGLTLILGLSSKLLLKKVKFSLHARLLLWFVIAGNIIYNLFESSFFFGSEAGWLCFFLLVCMYIAAIKTLFEQVQFYSKRFLACEK